MWIIFFVALGSSVTARCQELIVRLQSGNTVIVEYTGVINQVTMTGKSDAIVALNFSKKAGAEHKAVLATPVKPEAKKKSKWLRIKMADPIAED